MAYYGLMFGLGLILLVWGSDLFVDSAVLLANRFRVSEVLIGATIVSFGTTLPETFFSTTASVQGMPEMALGNALGSILCNTGLIAGILLLLRPISLERQELKSIGSGGFFLGAGFLIYTVSGALFGGLTKISGFALLSVCVLYILATIQNAKGKRERRTPSAQRQAFGAGEMMKLPLEAAAIYLGANMLVTYGPGLAEALGIPEMIISLTFVALGTSLPELVTSLVSLRKQHSSLSLGNIIGANILNLVLVGGLSSVICPIHYPDNIMRLELPFIFYMLSVLCIPSMMRKKAGRAQGAFLAGGYILYLAIII